MTDFLTSLLVILISILVVGILAVLARYTREINAARQRIGGLGSQVIETTCGSIEYAQVGEGYPLLIVHGAMGGFDQGLWLGRSFDITNYQVVSVSRFGYLRSPLPAEANLDSQADAFACLLDALEIRKAAVFAASAGTTSAIRFAARHPERISALVLLGPDAPGNVQMAMPSKFIFDTLLRSDFVYWVMVTLFAKKVQSAIGLVPKGYVLTPEQEAMLKKVQLGDLPTSRRIDGLIFETYTCADEFKASVSPNCPYPLSKIETPALIINALDDPISIPQNVRRLVEQMPNARLFVVPDGGHFLFGHTEEVKSEITQFLQSLVGSARQPVMPQALPQTQRF